jgi:hypothetical protein
MPKNSSITSQLFKEFLGIVCLITSVLS